MQNTSSDFKEILNFNVKSPPSGKFPNYQQSARSIYEVILTSGGLQCQGVIGLIHEKFQLCITDDLQMKMM